MHSQIMGVSVAASHLFTHTKPILGRMRRRGSAALQGIQTSIRILVWQNMIGILLFFFLFLFVWLILRLGADDYPSRSLHPSKMSHSV